jgi:hypothetical protein
MDEVSGSVAAFSQITENKDSSAKQYVTVSKGDVARSSRWRMHVTPPGKGNSSNRTFPRQERTRSSAIPR